MIKKLSLVIKHNNVGGNEPCTLCYRYKEPEIGPAIFIEGTWDFVCNDCAADIGMGWELVEAVNAWRNERERQRASFEAYEFGSIAHPKDLDEESNDGLDLDVWGEVL